MVTFDDIMPSKCLGIPIFDSDKGEMEKIAILHCLPSDQASDLYVFEAVNNDDLLENTPFELFHERNRSLRIEQDTRVPHEITMNNGAAVRFLLHQTMNEHSISLS